MKDHLPPEDCERLVKVLRMLSSPHEGESAAAGRRAHEMLKRLGLDWSDVIGTEKIVIVEKEVSDDDIVELVQRCRVHREELTVWEWDFCGSIAEGLKLWGSLTPKQRAVLDRIIVKLRAKGAW
jgi:hypothetical protein